ncbi:T1SS-143 repeat domain-containing protein [Psychromonas algarum]|uniref:T1SS-143 repeat domain-containing protein n=1 Tax=Psychromonas algarum TaxID=2555643 RepID=UPI00141A2DE7|nr:hypothetical protein [Psychromonas sp. RZ22]
MASPIMLYVELEGKIWAITEDGSWLAVVDPLPASIEIPFIRNLADIVTENIAGDATFTYKGKTIVVDQAQLEAADPFDSRSTPSDDNTFPTIESDGGLGFAARIHSDEASALARAGYQSRGFIEEQSDDTADENHLPARLSNDAQITILIEDGSDNTINQFEVNSILIHGTTIDVDDDREVHVTVTDQFGNSLTFVAIVTNNEWTLEPADLASLSQGPITAGAVITDFYENTISAETDSNIDTLADIDIRFDEQENDNVINQAESLDETLSGTVNNVEDGQIVTVSVTDSTGKTAKLTTSIVNGQWQLPDNDLSIFSDGELTAVATVYDVAGNVATSQVSILKDTLAEIELVIDSGDDEWLNGQEVTDVTFSGTVTGVEDGQVVTLISTDEKGYSKTVTAVVENGQYSISDVDLTGVHNGSLTVTASVSDQAGNPATVTNNIDVDLSAFIVVRFAENGDTFINAEEVVATTIRGISFKVDDGQDIVLTVTDSEGKSLTFTTKVDGNLFSITENLSSLAEGKLTVTAETTDSVGNTATSSDDTTKDTLASITIAVDSGDDSTLNNAEVVSTHIFGTVANIEDGQTVTVDVTDGTATLSFTATVVGGAWSVDSEDLSGLSEGELSFTATASDVAGNPAMNTTEVIKDTEASITIAVDSGDDSTLNNAEVVSTHIFGTVANIEDGQTVTVDVTDGTATLSFTATVVGGAWSVDSEDLSGLSEGELSFTATASDVAGNPAMNTTEVIKDTEASVTIDIKTDGNFDDNVINKVESEGAEISGTAANVEDGRMVNVVIVDDAGGKITQTAMVNNGIWILPSVDLSSLAEGVDNITATATVSDLAGNSTSAEETVSKDTLASVDVEIISGEDKFLNSNEISTVTIKGSVFNIEDGQTVTLTITDQSTNELIVTAIVVNGEFVVDPVLDLSGFVEGQIEVSAEVIDDVGNVAIATDNAVKDTELTIDIDTDTNNGFPSPYEGFNTFDFMNGNHTSIGGTTSAEEGQEVTVTISDGVDSVSFTGFVGGEGRWLVDNIDIDSLDNTKVWDLTVSVADLAGNEVSDSMPDLNILDQITFAEDDLVDRAVAGEVALEINSPNTDISFSEEQPQLENITSEGQSVFSRISDDGLSIDVYRSSDGQLVFNAVIDSNGTSVHISMFAPLDHAVDSDSLITELFIKAVQTDDDGTTETSVMPLVFEVIDSQPIALADTYQAVEAETTTGSLLTNDTAIDGDPVVHSVTFEGVTVEVSSGEDAVFDTNKGKLTVSLDGSWTFVAAHNLNNTIEQKLEFEYSIIDLDGDIDSAPVTITITDGDAGTIDAQVESHIEPDVTKITEFIHTFTVNAGSDDLVANSIRFDVASVDFLNGLGLSSNGAEIIFTINDDNTQIIGSNSGNEIIFTLTVSAIENGADLTGTLNFEQHLPLDHITSDELTISVGVLATDSDGTDTSTGIIDWTIDDGNNASIENTQQIAIDEVDLSNGPVQGSGLLEVTPGSDNTVSIAFDVTKQPDLTAAGETVQYRLNGDVLEGFTGTTPNDVLIFEVALTGTLAEQSQSGLGYDITLYHAIDQIDPDGHHIDSLDVPFTVTVTDGDNDITDQSLIVNIADSGEAIITGDGFTVSETPKAPSTATEITANDSIVISITADKDPVTSLTLNVKNGDAVTLSDGTEVTQNGQAVLWQDNGNGDYKGVLADGTVVFTLLLPDSLFIEAGESENIDLTLTLVGPVDHDKDLYDEQLTIRLPLVVTDSDYSTIDHDIDAVVFDGELPSLDITEEIYLDENATLNDEHDSDKTNYDLIEGSDQVVSVEPILAGQEIPGITSNGNPITFAAQANDNGWWIARSSEGSVFKVRFNLDGTINTQLLGVLDHPDEGDDTLQINIDVQAVDADGDVTESGANNITLNIVDDVPESNSTFILVEEGSSHDLALLANNEAGADGGTITYIAVFDKNGDFITEVVVGEKTEIIIGETNYGSLLINADGTGNLTTNETLVDGLGSLGDIVYTITDGDGDTAESNLIVGIADAMGDITIANTSLTEDHPQILALKVYVGDVDNNEALEKVVFKAASLLGGVLTFNGVLLSTNADGDYVLDGSFFKEDATGVYVPNGDLIFAPLLNSSNETQSVALDIDALVSKDAGADRITETISNTIDISVTSLADAPIWDTVDSTFEYSLLEDDEQQSININADLFDNDGSEVLTYQIGNIDEGLTLFLNGTEIITGDTLSAEDIALIEIVVAPNIAGTFTFDVTPTATEKENNDTQDGETKTVVFNVQPVADAPTLAVFDAKGYEDEIILLNQAINGQLTDTDGSETLSYLITVPDGWSVVAIDGSDAVVTVIDAEMGIYRVIGEDVSAGEVGLLPAPNVSSETGTFEIKAQAISTESTQDGQDPAPGFETNHSNEKTFEVIVKGVVDTPIVTPGGGWDFDSDTQIISNAAALYEDNLISLDIAITTVDQDGSESINLLLSNLPQGFLFVDADGNNVDLEISGFDGNGNPIYQISLADLQNLNLKPLADFSGKVSFNIDSIITEADGDARPDGSSDDDLFSMTVEMDILPVVDTSESDINLLDKGEEDTLIQLYLYPDSLSDSDGSEQLSAFTIEGLASTGLTLYFDGAEITTPVDLSHYLDTTNSTLESLLDSGRFAIKPPIDGSGTFNYDITYEITDTSETGETSTSSFSDQATIEVSAKVEDLTSPENETIEDITRIEGTKATQVSSDGSAISLDGLVLFYDQDNDGSEHIDYVVIQVPNADDWLVTHPTLNVIHDGEGRWLIDMSGITSDSVIEDAMDLLTGVTVYNNQSTLLSNTIQIFAHVLDGDDKKMIETTIQVHFTEDGSDSSASDIQPLQKDYIEGDEDSPIDIGSQININVAGDDNDIVSFKILASDLPLGGVISGSGVIVDYDSTGKNVVQYVFTEASLATLVLSGLDEDFAGIFEVPITAIATDSDSGDSLTENQTLAFEINPVVDGLDLVVNVNEVLEDTMTSLDLETVFADSNLPGEGIESLISLTFTLVDGGTLMADDGVLTETSPGVYQVDDLTQLQSISYQGPLNVSGAVDINFSAEIVDTANGYDSDLTASETVEGSFTVDITPVTDKVNITSEDSVGDEDTYISISGLNVEFIDSDGSETMSIELTGIPAGSVLVYGEPGNYVLLPNNGVDGGSFNGQPTYKWSIDESQLATLSIRPPLDFSGDIPLSVSVISHEIGTTDYVTTEGNFILEVNPVGDKAVFTSVPEAMTGVEGQVTHFDLQGMSTETESNETLILTVKIADGSDSTTMHDLDRIRVGNAEAQFTFVGGYWVATLEIDSNELNGFDLLTGPDAFGHFEIEIGLASKDSAIVGGKLVEDIGETSTVTTTLDLTAVVDAPILTLDSTSITTEIGEETPLPIELVLINPDSPSEYGYVEITGLPDGATISNATESDGVWTVLQDDLDNAMIEGLSTEGDFTLVISPYATLDGDTVSSNSQTIDVTVLPDSSSVSRSVENNSFDEFFATSEDDVFVFNSEDQGSAGSPAIDVINGFEVGADSIDLSDLYSARADGDINALIGLDESSGNTILEIKSAGTEVTQQIIIENTSIDDLYGADASAVSDADILSKLLADTTLITGSV